MWCGVASRSRMGGSRLRVRRRGRERVELGVSVSPDVKWPSTPKWRVLVSVEVPTNGTMSRGVFRIAG